MRFMYAEALNATNYYMELWMTSSQESASDLVKEEILKVPVLQTYISSEGNALLPPLATPHKYVINQESIELLRLKNIFVEGDIGHRNRIIVDPNYIAQKIIIRLHNAQDNTFVFGNHFGTRMVIECYGNRNAVLAAGANVDGHLHLTILRDSSAFIWGSGTFVNSATCLLEGPGSLLAIRENCLLSFNIIIRTSDLHSIIDIGSGRVINLPKNVVVGPNVWIGQEVMITKGATIGEGAVIGARALVASDIPAKTLAIGIPARVLRENVTWSVHSQASPEQIEDVLARYK